MDKKHSADRHRVECYYTIRAKKYDGRIVLLNTAIWPNQNPDGLAEITKQQVPDWVELEIQKSTLVFDTRIHKNQKNISRKISKLRIGKNGFDTLCTKVDENLKKDGKIPANLAAFFDARQNNQRI